MILLSFVWIIKVLNIFIKFYHVCCTFITRRKYIHLHIQNKIWKNCLLKIKYERHRKLFKKVIASMWNVNPIVHITKVTEIVLKKQKENTKSDHFWLRGCSHNTKETFVKRNTVWNKLFLFFKRKRYKYNTKKKCRTCKCHINLKKIKII